MTAPRHQITNKGLNQDTVTTDAKQFWSLKQSKGWDYALAKKCTSHFTWRELLHNRDKDDLAYLTLAHCWNLQALAIHLESVREFLGGKSITITSGWRDSATNRRVKGASGSQHLKGKAADFTVVGLAPSEVQKKLNPWWPQGLGLGSTTFTHIDIRGVKARFNY